MSEEKRMLYDYEIVEAVSFSDREIVLCQNHKLPKPYLVAHIKSSVLGDNVGDKKQAYDAMTAFEDFSDRVFWQVRQQKLKNSKFQDVQLLGIKECVEGDLAEILEGKVVVLKPEALPIDKQASPYQLGLVYKHYDHSPKARGRVVIVARLGDGESEAWKRDDILGVADPEKLPEWAQVNLSGLTLSVTTEEMQSYELRTAQEGSEMERQTLPDICYHAMPESHKLCVIFRGDTEILEQDYSGTSTDVRTVAERFNRARGITKAQESAMLGGALFGWHTPCADPARYDAKGILKQSPDRLKRAVSNDGKTR